MVALPAARERPPDTAPAVAGAGAVQSFEAFHLANERRLPAPGTCSPGAGTRRRTRPRPPSWPPTATTSPGRCPGCRRASRRRARAHPAPRLRLGPRRAHDAHPPRHRTCAREPGTCRAGPPHPAGRGGGSMRDDDDLGCELERLASIRRRPSRARLERVAARRHRRLRRRRGAVATAAALAVLTAVTLAGQQDRGGTAAVCASCFAARRCRARRQPGEPPCRPRPCRAVT